MRVLGMKPLEDTVSLTIEIPRGLYELAVRYQEPLKDEPGCETTSWVRSRARPKAMNEYINLKLAAWSDS
jgi:hypothetical protein